MVATRGAERRGRPHCGPSPQLWSEGGSGDEAWSGRRERCTRRTTAYGHRRHLPGTRPAPLPVAAGSQGVWPGAPRQPGSVVPSVISPALAAPAAETVGAAALSFLLAQSLAAQQQEEEEAKEQAAVTELETQVAAAEDRLLVQLQRERKEGTRITRQTWCTLSRVEQLAVHWFMARKAVEEKKGKWKRKKKKRRRRSTVRGYSGR